MEGKERLDQGTCGIERRRRKGTEGKMVVRRIDRKG